jgi:hypothetical protein
MHVLVEHTNDEHGDKGVEHVPRVIGMSIPRLTNARLWAIFALAHFKAFDVSTELLGVDEDLIESYARFAFCSRSLRVMKNWEAVYECEDERDADRLRKRAQLTSENKALTASITKGADDEELDFALQPKSTHHSERDFRIQQAVLELQQAGWLERSTANTSSLSQQSDYYPDGSAINRLIKGWKIEVKLQEEKIATTRHNALNPDQQIVLVQTAPETENDLSNQESLHKRPAVVTHYLPTEVRRIATVAATTKQSASDIVNEIGSTFNLNIMQLRAFHIITSHFIKKYVDKKLESHPVDQLTMLMTGPGSMGKTHVVKTC